MVLPPMLVRAQNHLPSQRRINSTSTLNAPEVVEETRTEPSTPTSSTIPYRRRGLQRERSALFVQAVLQYDRAENDLQPWFW
jgi:hypothetical protein